MDSLSQAVETALGTQQTATDIHESPIGDDSRQQPAAAVKPKKRIDHHLWGTYLLLVMIACIELFSASVQEVHADDIFSPLIRHGRCVLIAATRSRLTVPCARLQSWAHQSCRQSS